MESRRERQIGGPIPPFARAAVARSTPLPRGHPAPNMRRNLAAYASLAVSRRGTPWAESACRNACSPQGLVSGNCKPQQRKKPMNALIRLLNKTGLLQSESTTILSVRLDGPHFPVSGIRSGLSTKRRCSSLKLSATGRSFPGSIPASWHPRSQLVPGRFGMAIRCCSCSSVSGIRGWGILGALGSTCTYHGHRHHHSVHAEWMGSALPGFRQWPETSLSS